MPAIDNLAKISNCDFLSSSFSFFILSYFTSNPSYLLVNSWTAVTKGTTNEVYPNVAISDESSGIYTSFHSVANSSTVCFTSWAINPYINLVLSGGLGVKSSLYFDSWKIL